MLDIPGIFQNKALIPKQALEFGFVKENETYIRTSKILNGQFYLTIRLRNSGLPDARVFDAESGEEYVLIHLAEAAGAFVGRHNFTSFCSADARVKGDLSRTITCSQWRREGDLVVYRVSADGFLYNMVRILVGTQLWGAAGKLAASDMHGILSAEDRNAAGPTAPAAGLYLNRVFYDSEDVNQ